VCFVSFDVFMCLGFFLLRGKSVMVDAEHGMIMKILFIPSVRVLLSPWECLVENYISVSCMTS
jgi:hypothetical protein